MSKVIIDTAELVSPEEAAKILKVSRATVYRKLRKGEIPSGKWNGRRLIFKGVLKTPQG